MDKGYPTQKIAIERILSSAISGGYSSLLEAEAKTLVSLAGINTAVFRTASTEGEALSAADEIGYPVTAKIMSRDILHKTEAGAVRVGVRDRAGLRVVLQEMHSTVIKSARIEGFLIEETVPKGVEVIVGVLFDPQFGPAAMFGTGGVAVDLFKDVSFGLLPITRDEAFDMIKEVKGYPLLAGFRGQALSDIDSLADTIIKMSGLIATFDVIREMEINPLIVHSRGVSAVDVRCLLKT
ncbi:MAG: acetate--CoA ligase family protein [Deltaproteobacteria bacterium]|nr:acetate--CoA ligase family protein [Deltaproteobacteria bacterium]